MKIKHKHVVLNVGWKVIRKESDPERGERGVGLPLHSRLQLKLQLI